MAKYWSRFNPKSIILVSFSALELKILCRMSIFYPKSFILLVHSRGKSLFRNLWKYLLQIRNLVRPNQKSLWKLKNLVRWMFKWFTPRVHWHSNWFHFQVSKKLGLVSKVSVRLCTLGMQEIYGIKDFGHFPEISACPKFLGVNVMAMADILFP